MTISRSQIDIPGEYDHDGNLVGGELFARRLWDPDADTRELQSQSPFLINAPVSSLDFTFSQEFMVHWKFKLGVKNLLNPEIKETYRTANSEEVYQSHARGRTFGAGISYSI